MKKAVLIAASAALLFGGCSKVSRKLNTWFGSATPTPVPAATAVPKASPTSKATTAPKATVTPKPAVKK